MACIGMVFAWMASVGVHPILQLEFHNTLQAFTKGVNVMLSRIIVYRVRWAGNPDDLDDEEHFTIRAHGAVDACCLYARAKELRGTSLLEAQQMGIEVWELVEVKSSLSYSGELL